MKRPILVDAFQWGGWWDETEAKTWAVEAIRNGQLVYAGNNRLTVAGRATADAGDWIVKDQCGALHACKSVNLSNAFAMM